MTEVDCCRTALLSLTSQSQATIV